MSKTKQELTSKDFFFCYSPHLAAYIVEQGINKITVAKHPSNGSMFTMFAQSEELSQAIKSYKHR